MSAATGMQQAANQKAYDTTMQGIRSNQSNPMGSLTWQQDPTTGQWTQTVDFNQPQQDIFNQQQANQQQIANMGSGMLGGLDTSQIDFSGAPGMGQVGQFNQQATDLYNQLAQPQLDRQANAQRARAAAMGIPEFGSQAGTTMNQQLADAAARSAMMGAQAGIQQGNTMFGQQNQLHQQGIQDILQQRTANLGQLSGLMGLGQNMTTPQFAGYQSAQMQVPDYMQAYNQQYQSQVNAANAKNASKGGLLGTIGGIAGSFLGGPAGGAIGSGLMGMFGGGGGSQAGMVNNLPDYYLR
jgi:hypothetical protein